MRKIVLFLALVSPLAAVGFWPFFFGGREVYFF